MKTNAVTSKDFFKPGDIGVYAVIILLVVALFFGFVINKNRSTLVGIVLTVSDKNNEVETLTYNFDNDELTVDKSLVHDVIISRENHVITADIWVHDGDFNTLVIDTLDRTAYIVESNCSYHKDCTLFAPIENAGDIIICVPHHLNVIGTGYVDDDSLVFG